MGGMLSKVRIVLEMLRDLAKLYTELDHKLSLSPGLPLPNPSTPFWAVPPSPLAKHGVVNPLPDSADVVVIGSGITGTSFARELLDQSGGSYSVVMLEARDVCSGATARNGGHITPELYHRYQSLEKAVGTKEAQSIIRFRRAHLPELLRVAEQEGLLERSQCRKVRTYDVFLVPSVFESMKANLDHFLQAFPEERGRWVVHEGPQVARDLQFCEEVYGAIETQGGAIHPYRFVTGLLTRLLQSYSSFTLHAQTPVTSIEASESVYSVVTPRGIIKAKHVIHTTNGWSSHLLTPMRRKIVPLRGHMTAQRPGTGFSLQTVDDSSQLARHPGWFGRRSFILYPSASEDRFDYLTQQLPNPKSLGSVPQAEFMFGGGIELGGSSFFNAVGCADDSSLHFPTAAYLSGALGAYFGSWWGGESSDEDKDFESGRIKKVWTGVLGVSADRMPWVGKLTKTISGRCEGSDGGEWIAAGFTGEGMTHAWLSGKALALMVLGREVDSIPHAFLVTEERWKASRMEDNI